MQFGYGDSMKTLSGGSKFSTFKKSIGSEDKLEILASSDTKTKSGPKEQTFISYEIRCEKSYFLFSYDNCFRKTCFWICFKRKK